MNIKEAEKLTGVSSRNIRFYEQKGLLTPRRNKENDYREYSAGDIQRLKLIRALRMVDMPLEQIREVLDGKVELHKAAIMQKEKLEEQMKKLKTVIRFCEELSEAEPENVSEVLVRMDKPENRKFLSKKWMTDFKEITKKVSLSLLVGLWLFVACVIFYVFEIILWFLPQGYMLSVALSLIALWGYIGYKLYEKNWWWVKTLLAHIIWTVCLAAGLFRERLKTEVYLLSKMQYVAFYAIKSVFTGNIGSESELSKAEYVGAFLVVLGIFLAGMLLGRVLQHRKRKENSRCSVIAEFFNSHKRIRSVARILLIVFFLALPASINYLGPVYSKKPINAVEYISYCKYIDAKVGGERFNLRMGEEMEKILSPEEWERKYIWVGLSPKTLEVCIGDDEVAMFTLYRNDVVRLLEGGGFLEPTRYVYYRLPSGTAKKVAQYVEANRLEDIP